LAQHGDGRVAALRILREAVAVSPIRLIEGEDEEKCPTDLRSWRRSGAEPDWNRLAEYSCT
jgi:hypothetical protein